MGDEEVLGEEGGWWGRYDYDHGHRYEYEEPYVWKFLQFVIDCFMNRGYLYTNAIPHRLLPSPNYVNFTLPYDHHSAFFQLHFLSN
jgi:hypothetical protein